MSIQPATWAASALATSALNFASESAARSRSSGVVFRAGGGDATGSGRAAVSGSAAEAGGSVAAGDGRSGFFSLRHPANVTIKQGAIIGRRTERVGTVALGLRWRPNDGSVS